MKRAVVLLALLLGMSCLVPVGGYYLALSVKNRDTAAAFRQFITDAAGTEAASLPDADTAESQAAPPDSASGEAPASSVPDEAGPELTVLVQDTSSGEVLQVPLRDYVIGAVASELPMTWADAALQAQAVAVHTYVLYCRDHNDTASMDGAWLTADPARRQGFMTDPVLRSYWGTSYEENYARLSALVDQVLDTVVTYEGAPAATSYFAISNGRTEASQNVWGQELPYLQGVDSAADKDADGYSAVITYTDVQMSDALAAGLGITPGDQDPDAWFGSCTYTDAGYIRTIDVCGISVDGTALRSALHLRSACFSISHADGLFSITTYGYGHGVGLSQTGAQAMAESGSTWQEILQHYFPGTELSAAE